MANSLQPLLPEANSINQQLPFDFANGTVVMLKREDLVGLPHPATPLSGNKYRKLQYNLQAAAQAGQHTLLTFGGAYSNHIAAVAAAGQLFGFRTIGIIRGEELTCQWQDNPTLRQAAAQGMQLRFVSRSHYRQKHQPDFLAHLQQEYGDFYVLPEGGTNLLAIQGCQHILTRSDCDEFDIIACAVGTGGTLAGIIEASSPQQHIVGFAALKGAFLANEVMRWTSKTNWRIITDYHCGGYAKTTPALLAFIHQFEQHTAIRLDPIYNGKMLFGLFDLIQKNYFPAHSRILAIHTGGLQGCAGFAPPAEHP